MTLFVVPPRNSTVSVENEPAGAGYAAAEDECTRARVQNTGRRPIPSTALPRRQTVCSPSRDPPRETKRGVCPEPGALRPAARAMSVLVREPARSRFRDRFFAIWRRRGSASCENRRPALQGTEGSTDRPPPSFRRRPRTGSGVRPCCWKRRPSSSALRLCCRGLRPARLE